MMVVTYEREPGEWLAQPVLANRFAISPPPGESLATVQQFEKDLQQWLHSRNQNLRDRTRLFKSEWCFKLVGGG